MSFPISLIRKPMGVTTRKNIKHITRGATIKPRKIPNLDHNILRGDKILDLNSAKIKKTREIKIDQSLIFSSFKIGHKPIIKNKAKKTIPKFRLELILSLGSIFIV